MLLWHCSRAVVAFHADLPHSPPQDDVQMTPLSDDMAWLDGLSDEEYDAYWDEVERCVAQLPQCDWPSCDAS